MRELAALDSIGFHRDLIRVHMQKGDCPHLVSSRKEARYWHRVYHAYSTARIDRCVRRSLCNEPTAIKGYYIDT